MSRTRSSATTEREISSRPARLGTTSALLRSGGWESPVRRHHTANRAATLSGVGDLLSRTGRRCPRPGQGRGLAVGGRREAGGVRFRGWVLGCNGSCPFRSFRRDGASVTTSVRGGPVGSRAGQAVQGGRGTVGCGGERGVARLDGQYPDAARGPVRRGEGDRAVRSRGFRRRTPGSSSGIGGELRRRTAAGHGCGCRG